MRDARCTVACCIPFFCFFVATSAVAYWNADTPKGCIVLESLYLALELEPAEHRDMKARLVKFGEIEVEGKSYTHDVVIDGGKVRKRKKGPSKQFRGKFGHTPLSAEEEIPWGGQRLIVGTGADGGLPVMDQVLAEAKRRGIEVIAAPTSEVCQLLEDVKRGQAYAILHCIC